MGYAKVWDETNQNWIGVGVEKAFSTIKINDVFIDADSMHDTLQILGGDNINVLPDETFTSVVITTTGIGDPSTLNTTETLVVDAINEINTLSTDNQTTISSHVLNNDIHVTTEMKTTWDNKQDKLTDAVNSHYHVKNKFDISKLTSNRDYFGDVSVEYSDETTSVFDMLYLSDTGYKKASAADYTNVMFPCVAMSLTNLPASSGEIELLKIGYIKNTNWNFTKGQIIYLSTTTGEITTTQPNNTGEIVQILGYAVDTDIIYFNPNYMWITI